ncbi:MAG: hypothetical protein L0177_11400 [Chloroflexi bacterium]|nr:hypothetical protein [Chloroflexota bacterium]
MEFRYIGETLADPASVQTSHVNGVDWVYSRFYPVTSVGPCWCVILVIRPAMSVWTGYLRGAEYLGQAVVWRKS